MKIYVCWTTRPTLGPRKHPCGLAHEAVVEAGYDPEVIYGRGWRVLPEFLNPGRKEVKELTGKLDVPILIFDDGNWIQGSREIIDWARSNPATAAG